MYGDCKYGIKFLAPIVFNWPLLNDDNLEEVAFLPQKDQKHGTCSYVNPKSALEGVLVLKAALGKGKKPSRNITIKDKHKREGRKEYKKLTRKLRAHAVDELVLSCLNSNIKDIDYSAIASYISEHHGQSRFTLRGRTDKKMAEIDNLFYIASELPFKYSEDVIKKLPGGINSTAKQTFVKVYAMHLKKRYEVLNDKTNLTSSEVSEKEIVKIVEK